MLVVSSLLVNNGIDGRYKLHYMGRSDNLTILIVLMTQRLTHLENKNQITKKKVFSQQTTPCLGTGVIIIVRG